MDCPPSHSLFIRARAKGISDEVALSERCRGLEAVTDEWRGVLVGPTGIEPVIFAL